MMCDLVISMKWVGVVVVLFVSVCVVEGLVSFWVRWFVMSVLKVGNLDVILILIMEVCFDGVMEIVEVRNCFVFCLLNNLFLVRLRFVFVLSSVVGVRSVWCICVIVLVVGIMFELLFVDMVMICVGVMWVGFCQVMMEVVERLRRIQRFVVVY